MRIFVYGTLKRGFCRHPALQGQEFLGECNTQSAYRLVHCSEYPGLIESSEGYAVAGELWEVDPPCLARLDAIEGVQEALYQRRAVRLAPPWDDRPAEAYFYLRAVAGLPDVGAKWL